MVGLNKPSINPSHDSIGPLDGGCNQRFGPWAWPAIVQIFGAFQMARHKYAGDDA